MFVFTRVKIIVWYFVNILLQFIDYMMPSSQVQCYNFNTLVFKENIIHNYVVIIIDSKFFTRRKYMKRILLNKKHLE